jgi:hypothetical protein
MCSFTQTSDDQGKLVWKLIAGTTYVVGGVPLSTSVQSPDDEYAHIGARKYTIGVCTVSVMHGSSGLSCRAFSLSARPPSDRKRGNFLVVPLSSLGTSSCSDAFGLVSRHLIILPSVSSVPVEYVLPLKCPSPDDEKTVCVCSRQRPCNDDSCLNR